MLNYISTDFPKRGHRWMKMFLCWSHEMTTGVTLGVTVGENLAVGGEISEKYILADAVNKKGEGSSNEEEREQLEAENMSIPSTSPASTSPVR